MSLTAPPEYGNVDWKNFKNSDYMKSIRLQMLNGKLPKECFLCEKSNAPVVLKDEYNLRYKEEIQSILATTAADGSTQHKLRYLDYRSNLCNLSCRMCGPYASNTFQKIINSADDEHVKFVFGPNAKKDPLVITKKFKDFYSNELTNLLENENITDIYFAGGEPLIEPNHLVFLDSAKKFQEAKNISIAYNSNLAFSQKILEKWLPYAQEFKLVSVMASIDGVGDIYEYVRHGGDFNIFDSNLDYLIKNSPSNFLARLDITLNSLNVFFLEDFARYCLAKKIPAYSRLMVSGEHLSILKPESVPQDIRLEILNRWNIFFKNLTDQEKNLLHFLNAGTELFLKADATDSSNSESQIKQLEHFESIFSQSNHSYLNLLKKDSIGNKWYQRMVKG